jgi:hypothetical protein
MDIGCIWGRAGCPETNSRAVSESMGVSVDYLVGWARYLWSKSPRKPNTPER